MSSIDKRQLRDQLRAQRRQLAPHIRESCGQAITAFAQTLPGWRNARNTALYLPNDGEIPTQFLAETCRRARQQLWLPVITSAKNLRFAHWKENDKLIPNRYGIGEPPADAAAIELDQLDLLFIPLVAWDALGNRLGMGGGYYDRSLATVGGPLRVGLAYAFQELPLIPKEPWDQGLDYVITEAGIRQIP